MKLTPETLARLQVGLFACGVPSEEIGKMTEIIAKELEDDSPIIDSMNVDKLQEIEAQCAVMREALEPFAGLEKLYRWVEQADPHHLFRDIFDLSGYRHLLDKVVKALSSDAGRDLLKRVKKLEVVAEEAQALVDEWDSDDIGVFDIHDLDGLRRALVALKGGEQDA